MAATLSGVFNLQQFTDAGDPLASGRLYTYSPGTTTKKTAYTESTGSTAHTYTSDGAGGEYIALDSRGEIPAPLFLTSGGYDLCLKTSAGVTVWTRRAYGAGDGSDTLRTDLADATSAAKGAGLVAFDPDLAYASGTLGKKAQEWVSVLDYGADPTGVALSNSAFDLAKAKCKTLLLPPGTYRLEGWTAQDVRLIGMRTHGANDGANEQTVIEGSGDLLVGANNFAMENLVIRNSSAGTRGKLITCAAMDTKLGPFVQVHFRKATYHVYAADTTKTLVGVEFDRCRFSDASVYSRYYEHALFGYEETACYTQSNKRGLFIRACSTALLTGVFELHEEGAVYVENTVSATDAIRGLKFQNIHFEANGSTTPTADVTINVTPSLARISFDSCGFYLPTVAGVVNLSSNTNLRILHQNCTDIVFGNVAAGTIITALNPKQAGQTNGVYVQGGNIGTGGWVFATGGFVALDNISTTITGSPTPTSIAMPAAGSARFVLVCDSTTEGASMLMLTNTAVTTIGASTLSNIAWTISGGFLHGNTTGGASSRVLFFNYIATGQ